MHAKMEVNFVFIKFTHVLCILEARVKKLKFMFRQNHFPYVDSHFFSNRRNWP